MNAARTNTGKRLSRSDSQRSLGGHGAVLSATVRKRRAASEARRQTRRAAANAVRYADVSVSNPPSF